MQARIFIFSPPLFPRSDNRTKERRTKSDAISCFPTPPQTIVALAVIDHRSGSIIAQAAVQLVLPVEERKGTASSGQPDS